MTVASDPSLLTARAGLVDRSRRGKLLLSGSEVAEFLQGQVTNDVEALAPGEGLYAAFLTHKGKMRGDLRVLRGDGWLWVDTEAVSHPALARTVQMYSLGRDVRFQDVTTDRSVLSLIGPGGDEALDLAPPPGEHAWVEGRYGLYVRTDLGVDVICPADRADAVRAALGVEEADARAAECLRIETGRPRYGIDMDESTIPQEAGLNERAISFTKGCYVGQETVARLFYKGRPNRHLRGLRLGAPAATGEAIVYEGRPVGAVGSACDSARFGPIALALVRREAAPGATVLVGAAEVPAAVVELPFTP